MSVHAFLAEIPEPAGETLVLVVPMPANVTNRTRGSTHWRIAWREKRDYWQNLDALAACTRGGWTPPDAFAGCTIPRAPASPLARVRLTAHYVLRGAMDDDNAAARAKPLLDWLVTRGYLASDRRTCVRWAAFPTQHVTRKAPARIHLTLTPATP